MLARGLKALPEDGLLRDAYAEVQIARLKKAIDGLKARLRDHPDDARGPGEAREARPPSSPSTSWPSTAAGPRPGPRTSSSATSSASGSPRPASTTRRSASSRRPASSPALKVKALIAAGGSFEATGVPKLAERSYAEALKAADADDPETLNDLHYRLGRVAEQMGNLEGAEEHYNEVAANNFGYLDVAQRLRSLNQRMSS